MSTLAELDDLLGRLDLDQPFPAAAEGPRGRQGLRSGGSQLPDGWLLDPDEMVVPDRDAEVDLGGG